jgi:hypothetical protein
MQSKLIKHIFTKNFIVPTWTKKNNLDTSNRKINPNQQAYHRFIATGLQYRNSLLKKPISYLKIEIFLEIRQ